MVLTIYHSTFSPFSRAAYWTIKALGVEHEVVPINLLKGDNKEESFLKINPRGKVPAIKDDDFVMSESRAIGCYVCNKYGLGSTLYPRNPEDKAAVDAMLYLGEAVSDAGIAWANPPGVMFQGKLPNEDKKEAFVKELQLIEDALSSKDYLAGDTLSIADIFFYVPITLLNAAKFDWTVYPAINQWMARMRSLPFHDEVNAEAFEFIGNLYQTKLAETQGAKPANGDAVTEAAPAAPKPPQKKKSSVCAIL